MKAHRNADVGSFQCGCVIHAVSGHRHDGAIGFPCLDDAQFVLGRDSRIDSDVRCARPHFIVTHSVQFCAAHCGVVGLGDAKFAGDGECRVRMIAGDHDHTNAGIAASRDRLLGFRSWRIVHSGKSDKDKIALKIFGDFVHFGALRQIAIRRAKHSQGSNGHGFVLSFNGAELSFIERDDAGFGVNFRAMLQEHIGRAVDKRAEPSIWHATNNRAALAFGIEGYFVAARQFAFYFRSASAGLVSDHARCAFSRIADDFPSAFFENEFGVVACEERRSQFQ